MFRTKDEQPINTRMIRTALKATTLTTTLAANFLLLSPNTNATSPTSNLSVSIPLVLSMNVASNIDFNINPTTNGTFSHQDLNIEVLTNNPTGYTLSLSDKDNDNNIKHINNSITKQIIPTADNKTKETFTNNTWGYSIDNSNHIFHPVPVSTTPTTLKTTNQQNTDTITILRLATKLDTTMPSGTYRNTILLSVVANYVQPDRTNLLPTLTSLQDPNLNNACTNTYTPPITATETTTNQTFQGDKVPEAELTDTRDNKTYIIRKLADGKCWMTQNLDLDLNTAIPLTSETTDLNSKTTWTPNNSTQTSTGTNWSWDTEDNQARSHNPGDIYYTGTGSTQSNSFSGPKYAHIGNYYNWYAATAGSGTYSMSTPGQTAQDSICPKGWKLPYGSNQEGSSTTGDYRNLTNTYGITSGANNNNTSDSQLLSSPLHFVRSGYYDYFSGQVNHQGSRGYVRSSSVCNQYSAHLLYFHSSDVSPQHSLYKGHGFSVRCLAR